MNIRNTFLILVLAISAGVFGQTGNMDPDIAAIMERVEGESGEEKVNYVLTAELATEAHKKASQDIEKYWRAILDDDLIAAYGFHIEGYRQVVKLQSYVKQKRLDIAKVEVTSVNIHSDTCAEVFGYITGYQGGAGELRIPFKNQFVKENDDWRLYKNPYSNPMGIKLPSARKFKTPCKS